jgi:hypothetical protein
MDKIIKINNHIQNIIHTSNCDCISCIVDPTIWIRIGTSLCKDINPDSYSKPDSKSDLKSDSKSDLKSDAKSDSNSDTNSNLKIDNISFGQRQITLIHFIKKIELFLNNLNYKFISTYHNNQIIEYKIICNELEINEKNSIDIIIKILNNDSILEYNDNNIKKNYILINNIGIRYCMTYYDYLENHIFNIKNFFNKNN